MTHLDEELYRLKSEIISMWNLVIHQLQKTQVALISLDKDLAREVIANERRVNGMELKIDRDCENIIALFNPVAIDLRFVLAILKTNNNLERTGDIANGIAKYITNLDVPLEENLLEVTQIHLMYKEAIDMLKDVLEAFEKEDAKLARKIFIRDEKLDTINLKASKLVADFIRGNPDKIEQGIYIISAIHKLERVGDQCKNIAEEIIFFIEAKVLKHTSGKK
ncbi:MAG TPA: phosphate signaling complex protein PhoU [Saprospiraceae bacterium]|nr:phosphate signaling complex protein PhoU [Saprospiraceae bacterium]